VSAAVKLDLPPTLRCRRGTTAGIGQRAFLDDRRWEVVMAAAVGQRLSRIDVVGIDWEAWVPAWYQLD
jgi:hypothetical protein